MKIERIQYSLEAATQEISRYAATRRVTAIADLMKEKAGSHHRKPTEDEDEDLEESTDSPVTRMQISARLLDITA